MVLWLGQAASSLACIHSLLPYVAYLPMSMFQQEYLLGFKTHPKKNNFDFLYPFLFKEKIKLEKEIPLVLSYTINYFYTQ